MILRAADSSPASCLRWRSRRSSSVILTKLSRGVSSDSMGSNMLLGFSSMVSLNISNKALSVEHPKFFALQSFLKYFVW